ncbi:MAG TPA: 1-phosphofructokinase [Kofleriaceae bacterium]|nr:1-phosphofructokinase [Kofleriaceae bacterium]
MIYTLTLNPAIDRELAVPSIVLGEVLRATAHRVDWGGKGFNVSRSLRALGGESTALGFVGGEAGRRIAAGLAQLGIAVDFVEIAGETRTNVTVVDGVRYLKVNEPGPTITAAEEARLIDKVRALARPGDWWVLSGSLPPGASPGIYADVIRIVQAAGARAVLDTSGAALAQGCAAQPFLVKPNAAEAAELTGRRVDPSEDGDGFGAARDAAADLHARGVSYVLLSLGRRGALLSDGRSSWMARPPRITERNPVGAGDSMVAGMVWGLAQGMPVERALRWAVASGAAAASLDGTAFGTHAEVTALEPQVEVAA